MDPNKHDPSEIVRRNQSDPWARRITDQPPSRIPERIPSNQPSLTYLLILGIVLMMLFVVLVVIGVVITNLGRSLRTALGDEGLAVVFYGFTLITLLGAIQLLKQRG